MTTPEPNVSEKMEREHELKTDPEVFWAVLDGRKTYEIRFNDRDFRVGDWLRLRETAHTGAQMRAGAGLLYTGREVRRQVSHVLRGPVYGLADGWVILSLAPAVLRTPHLPVQEQDEGERTIEAAVAVSEQDGRVAAFTCEDWGDEYGRITPEALARRYPGTVGRSARLVISPSSVLPSVAEEQTETTLDGEVGNG